MPRFLAVFLAVSLFAGAKLAGCSVLLSVEADCEEVAACGAYRCDSENVACRTTCDRDSHCSSGFSCDLATNECVSSGCMPSTPVRQLPVSTSFDSFSVASGAGWVVFGLEHRSGHFLRRFSIGQDGTLQLIRESAEDEQLDAFRLSASSVGATPQHSHVLHNPRALSGLDEDRFHFGWRSEASSNRWRLTTRTLRATSPPALRPSSGDRAVDTLLSRFQIRDIQQAPRVGGYGYAWVRSEGSQNSRVLLRQLDGDGNPDGPEELHETLVIDNVNSGNVVGLQMMRLQERLLLAWAADLSANQREVRTSSLQAGTVVAPGDEPAPFAFYRTERLLTDLALTRIGSAGSIAWREASTGNERFRIRQQWIDEEGRPLAGRDAISRVDPGFVHQPGTGTRLVGASRSDDFALVFPALRAGRNDIWLTRFDRSAQIGLPVPVTESGLPGEEPPAGLAVVAYTGGFTVIWTWEESSSTRRFYYRSFACSAE